MEGLIAKSIAKILGAILVVFVIFPSQKGKFYSLKDDFKNTYKSAKSGNILSALMLVLLSLLAIFFAIIFIGLIFEFFSL